MRKLERAGSGRALNCAGQPGRAVRVCPDAGGGAQCQTGGVQPSAAIFMTTTKVSAPLPAHARVRRFRGRQGGDWRGGRRGSPDRAAGPGRARLQLPDFDGFEVARRLAAVAARDLAPVVVLTSAHKARDYGLRLAASPAAGFLPKDELSGAALRRFLAQDVP